ncbi:hypothetical protein ABZ484_13305 [Streptomyces sp. NPDC006393]|uniref:hypothetical protein n=1 Tax=Streptomyces sp. NPDC006393 TaxID=3156763 RepID=UPI003409C553
MYGYELHRLRSADLRREADRARMVREALRVRRAARRSAAQKAPEAESHSSGGRRHRFTPAA